MRLFLRIIKHYELVNEFDHVKNQIFAAWALTYEASHLVGFEALLAKKLTIVIWKIKIY